MAEPAYTLGSPGVFGSGELKKWGLGFVWRDAMQSQ